MQLAGVTDGACRRIAGLFGRADELGIAPRAVLGKLERLTRGIEPAAAALAVDFSARYQCPETMATILEIIRRRAGRAWAFLGGRPE